MPIIGGFRSDLSITRKTDKNFGNVSASVLFFQSRVSTKTVVIVHNKEVELEWLSDVWEICTTCT